MDPNTAVVVVAFLSLVGSLGGAALSAFVAIRVNGVKQDVRKIEVATNSMKDELIRLSRAEGKQEGKDEVNAALDQTARDVEAGRKIERIAPPAPPVIPV